MIYVLSYLLTIIYLIFETAFRWFYYRSMTKLAERNLHLEETIKTLSEDILYNKNMNK